MRTHEFITIYTAVGAPFGTTLFLKREKPRLHLELLTLVGGTLLWPLVAASILYKRIRVRRTNAQDKARETNSPEQDYKNNQRVRRAESDLLRRLNDLEDLLAKTSEEKNGKWRRLLFEARTGIEKFAGLTLAVAETPNDLQPREQETALCRASGREGDDLIIAGRCVRRRNRRRLAEHSAQAQTQFINALANLENILTFGRESLSSAVNTEKLSSELLLKIYCHAFDLASTLDDQAAALAIAGLINAACARLRRIENHEVSCGEKSCLPEFTRQQLNVPLPRRNSTLPQT